MLDFLKHRSCSIEAALDLSKMIVTSESINESSSKVSNSIKSWKMNVSVDGDCISVHVCQVRVDLYCIIKL